MEPFWAAVLGYDRVRQPDGSGYLRSPASGLVVWVNAVPEPKTAKNRVHLDVYAESAAQLLALGATIFREPIENEPWWVLLDPEGGEFCVFPREQMPAERLCEVVVDSADFDGQVAWWSDVMGGDIEHEKAWSSLVRVPGMPFDYLVFGSVPEPKTIKNRVHWDVTALTPDALDELLRRGATLLREPSESEGWHILADPEGNEFCLFSQGSS
jgi:hypothetical protein